jgi:hypothetical protein
MRKILPQKGKSLRLDTARDIVNSTRYRACTIGFNALSIPLLMEKSDHLFSKMQGRLPPCPKDIVRRERGKFSKNCLQRHWSKRGKIRIAIATTKVTTTQTYKYHRKAHLCPLPL